VLAKKRKLSKKEIKEDKLVTTFYEAKSFYEKNQTAIFAVVGAVAALIAVILFYSSRVDEKNLAASTELTRVLPTYNAGLYQQAIDGKPGTKEIGLLKIVDEYGGSEQGELARIYLANAYYFTGQVDKALEQYDSYSGNDDIMIAAALAGKAGCYETKGDYEEAAKLFEKAANVSKYVPANGEYLLNAGINLIKINKYNKAKVLLNKVKKDYPTTMAAREVEKFLAIVNS
jgi:tetratricopeptide (TPR) repeat protein